MQLSLSLSLYFSIYSSISLSLSLSDSPSLSTISLTDGYGHAMREVVGSIFIYN